MTECNYCSDTFTEEDKYIQHLVDEHKDELSTIDKRRVQQHETIELEPELTYKGMLLQTMILLIVICIITAGYYFVIM